MSYGVLFSAVAECDEVWHLSCLTIGFGNQDVRGELVEPVPVRGTGESLTRTIRDSDTLSRATA